MIGLFKCVASFIMLLLNLNPCIFLLMNVPDKQSAGLHIPFPVKFLYTAIRIQGYLRRFGLTADSCRRKYTDRPPNRKADVSRCL
ncbi:hypothetical protein D3C87_1761430 [compost metagenome]